MRTCTMRCIVVAGAALPFPLVYSRCCRSCSARTERDGTSLRDVLVTPSAREIAICFSIRRYLRHLPVVRVSRLCILPYFDTYDNAAALLRGRNLFLICIRSVHGDPYTIVRSLFRSDKRAGHREGKSAGVAATDAFAVTATARCVFSTATSGERVANCFRG